MSAPTTPVGQVPHGTRVVHEGEVVTVTDIRSRLYVQTAHAGRWLLDDTPVLELEGTAPRPLSECVGRDVWASNAVWTWTPELAGCWVRPSGSRRYPGDRDPGHLAWPIARPDAVQTVTAERGAALALLTEIADEGCKGASPGQNYACPDVRRLDLGERWCYPCRARAHLDAL